MSAMPPVSVLPAMPAPAAATGAPTATAAAGNAPAAENNGGFADALQQARHGAARTRESLQKAAQKEGGKDRVSATREPARTEAPAKTAPADETTPATGKQAVGTTNDRQTDADTGLPPWLAQALNRTPVAAELPAAGELARAAQASLAGTATGADTASVEADGPHESAATSALDLAGARPSTRTNANANANASAHDSSHAAAAQASEDSHDQAAARAEPALPAANEAAPTAATPAPTSLASPPTGGFSLPAASAAGAVDRPIAAPVPSPAFAPALGAELTLMVKEGVSEARLHLNPAEMGPITVQIVVEGQTARVEMTADNAATRQALEQAMPALAGALREDGLTLTGGGVFEQARQPRQGGDARAQERPGQPANTAGHGNDSAPADAAAPRPVPLARGRVDLYA